MKRIKIFCQILFLQIVLPAYQNSIQDKEYSIVETEKLRNFSEMMFCAMCDGGIKSVGTTKQKANTKIYFECKECGYNFH